jgi:FkbM family methyltransferase
MNIQEIIAEARGTSVEEVNSKFRPAELKYAPKTFSKYLADLRDTLIDSTGIEDGLAWVKLKSGKVFYSPITHGRLKREYSFISDTIPSSITADTYLAAIDVVQRYLKDYAWPPEGLVKNTGANIIEFGAYLGHKTVRFADELASGGGKVLAVELMPENCEILVKTINANGLQNVIEVMPVGVWKESGMVEIFSKGRQRNSILPIEKLENGERYNLPVLSINEIVQQWGVSPVDLGFVTINGAEVEVLSAFDANKGLIKSFFVAALYNDGEQSRADLCRDVLKSKGYRLIDINSRSRVIATRD